MVFSGNFWDPGATSNTSVPPPSQTETHPVGVTVGGWCTRAKERRGAGLLLHKGAYDTTTTHIPTTKQSERGVRESRIDRREGVMGETRTLRRHHADREEEGQTHTTCCDGLGWPAGPEMKPSWFSFEMSSSDLCFVSGMRRVEKIPVSMKNAKISRLWATPSVT